MRKSVLFVVVAGLLVAADQPKEEAVKKELDRFKGTWKIVSLEMNGQKTPAEGFEKARLILKGDQFKMTMGEESFRGTFQVDPTQKPKTIEVTFTEGPDKGKTCQGIYELKGDTYKVCIGMPGNERPKEFATKKDSGHVLEVFERVKQ